MNKKPSQNTMRHELREKGKRAFLSDSKIKERLYHATPKDFNEFKAGGYDPRISGHAIWLGSDPSHLPAAHHIGDPKNPKHGVQIMPVHVQAKNPMVLDDKNMLEWAQAVYANGSKEFPELMPKEWADKVKEDYDSIIHADPHGRGDPHEIIMFHANKIKSAFGNRGTYDTKENDMTKAEGGKVSRMPPEFKKFMEEFRIKAAHNEALNKEYKDKYERHYDPNQPTFAKWLEMENKKRMAKGGDVHTMGINVKTDKKAGKRYADLIVDGHKVYESRNSDTLRPYVGKRIAIVRTGEGPAKAIGEVTVGEPMIVNRKKFREMESQHLVPEGSAFDIDTPTKHLYPMHDPIRYKEERNVGHGIISRKVIHKAIGGSMESPSQPTLAQMRVNLARHANPDVMSNIGINEAMDMDPKIYMNPDPQNAGMPSVGGVSNMEGLPIGGVDENPAPGQQLMPAPTPQAQPVAQPPQGEPNGSVNPNQPQSSSGLQPPAPQSNILSLTKAGQAMQAMKPNPMGQQPAQGLADGGQPIKMVKKEDILYDQDNPNTPSLTKAFQEAIKHHLSLPEDERRNLSMMAENRVAQHIGRVKTGPMRGRSKDLLGKNAKLLKSEKGKKDKEAIELPDGRGVETTGLALAPAYEQGKFNTCPNHASCKEECLGKTSGNYFKLGGGPDLEAFKGPRLNSLLKTQAFLRDPHAFAIKLHDEIESAKAMAAKNGNHLGMRLNVLSDIHPEVYRPIIEAHPDVTFYDYTKMKYKPIAKNHHYTYSSTGLSQEGVHNHNSNWHQMRERLDSGDNVAMAFSHKRHLPSSVYDEDADKHYEVIDGDSHDFRPLDKVESGKSGVIVGLKNKKATGKMNEAHLDSHGFFVHYDPQEVKTRNAKGAEIFAKDESGQTIPANRVVNIKSQAKNKQGE